MFSLNDTTLNCKHIAKATQPNAADQCFTKELAKPTH